MTTKRWSCYHWHALPKYNSQMTSTHGAKQATHDALKSPTTTNRTGPPFWTFPNGGHGFNHGFTWVEWLQCHTYNYRPQLLQSHKIYPLHHNHHWRRCCDVVPTTSSTMVWHPLQNHQWSWPQIHITFHKGIMPTLTHSTKHVNHISPMHQWHKWMGQSMAWTIFAHLDHQWSNNVGAILISGGVHSQLLAPWPDNPNTI